MPIPPRALEDVFPNAGPFSRGAITDLSSAEILAKTIAWYRSLAERARLDADIAERDAKECQDRAADLRNGAGRLDLLADQLDQAE